MTLTIIGAGMAGLLAGHMLARHKPVIFEKQPALPNNHSAVLRFRSSVVGDTLGIAFRSVNMIKATLPWRNPVADALAYSYKNTGVYKSDRSVTAGLVSEKRYIAPPDLIQRMAEGQNILYGQDWTQDPFTVNNSPQISTIPMPVLMKALNYPQPHPDFKHTPIVNVHANMLDADAYVSLLVPNPEIMFSRVSMMGQQLVVECPRPKDELSRLIAGQIAMEAGVLLGVENGRASHIDWSPAEYGKILPIDETVRRDFIVWASQKHNVWSLGRFATWRPGLLLDDLVKDVRLIEGWIERRDRYGAAKHW